MNKLEQARKVVSEAQALVDELEAGCQKVLFSSQKEFAIALATGRIFKTKYNEAVLQFDEYASASHPFRYNDVEMRSSWLLWDSAALIELPTVHTPV